MRRVLGPRESGVGATLGHSSSGNIRVSLDTCHVVGRDRFVLCCVGCTSFSDVVGVVGENKLEMLAESLFTQLGLWTQVPLLFSTGVLVLDIVYSVARGMTR